MHLEEESAAQGGVRELKEEGGVLVDPTDVERATLYRRLHP
ncbi:hypothetical protein [Nocardiopsis nanhaiensis]